LIALVALLATINGQQPVYGQEAPKIKYGDTIPGEIAETERGTTARQP
jgi:hypothetical protein